MSRFSIAFGALILAQAAHFIEEYAGRLWQTFPPARFLSGLVSADLERGFVVINVSVVAFGVWCFAWPVRRAWPSAAAFVQQFLAIEEVRFPDRLRPVFAVDPGLQESKDPAPTHQLLLGPRDAAVGTVARHVRTELAAGALRWLTIPRSPF